MRLQRNLVGACLRRCDRISLRQGATLSQMCFAVSCLFLQQLDFKAYNHGLKGPPKPKTDCDNKLLRSYLSAPVFTSEPAQGGQLQLKQTSDATSLLCLCCRASVSVAEKGTSDVASRAPRDESRSCRCRPFCSFLLLLGQELRGDRIHPVSRRLPRQHLPTMQRKWAPEKLGLRAFRPDLLLSSEKGFTLS